MEAMPQIDLEPTEYRSQRSRRNANAHGLMALVGVAILAYVWWNRGDLSTDTLYWGTVAFGLPTGGFMMVFLNQFRGV